MSNEYTWNIMQLDYVESENSLSNVVKRIHYRVDVFNQNDTIDSYVHHMYGVVSLDSPTDNVTFINIEDLTIDTLKNWILQKLGKTELEIQNELDDLKANPYLMYNP